MEVSITEKDLQVGSVVVINDVSYMVMELPSCATYDNDRFGRHFLMNLTGQGYWDYPTNLDRLMTIVKNANGVIYDKDTYKIEIKSK